MSSFPSGDDQGRPLYVSIEMVANLIYLARQSEGRPEQQRAYLERAADLLFDLRENPRLSH